MPQQDQFAPRRPSLAVISSGIGRSGYRHSLDEGKESNHAALDIIPEESVFRAITIEELYDKEKYDLSTMEYDDVFNLLESSKDGLTDNEVNIRLEKFGHNRLESKEKSAILQFLLFMWNPLSWVMEAAAIMAIALANGDNRPPDWYDFVGIILLLLANAVIGYIEQRNAGNAVKALMASLAPEAKVKRNGMWKTIDAADLVPGDIIAIKLGDVVPADGRLIAAHGTLSIDQAALTGESLPATKDVGDEIFSGSTCKQGEAEAIIIGTGTNTFFGRAATLVGSASQEMGHLQIILAKIGNFCIISIAIFLVAEILIMYPVHHYTYRNGIDNLLVLLIGGIPIAMPTVLSVTLAIGAKQLSEHKAIVTHVTAIEELAAVTILCSDKTGTLTLNKLMIDRQSIKQYSELSQDDIIRHAAYACRGENQDAIDFCVVNTFGNPLHAREGIEELHFRPFNPVDKRTEITYRRTDTSKIERVMKGMAPVVLELCTRERSDEQDRLLYADVDEFARRGLRALAVALDDTEDGEQGYRLIGLLPIYDPPREDTKETIARAIELGVKVKMITGDQLAIAKETGRRLGMGDNMFLSTTLQEGPPIGLRYKDVDDMVLHADGFAGVYPEHKYEIVERLQKMGYIIAMTGDGVNDAPALARANVGVAVADATDAARSASDIVLTEPGLSVIIEAILGSRQIFQRMRNYSIYTCAITIRILLGFSILVFAFKFDFPPFLVLILAILNDGTIMTISKDRVTPSPYPNHWNLFEIFSYAIVYGIYLAASTIVFFVVVTHTRFFHDTFGVHAKTIADQDYHLDYKLHSIIYLQVSTISQALIFITRTRGLFFLDRPSLLLVGAFVIAQVVATIIAVYADWDFTYIEGCGWGWAAIIWVWNIIWFFPLDGVKFLLRLYFDKQHLMEIEELKTSEPSTQKQIERRHTTFGLPPPMSRTGTQTSEGGISVTRRDSILERPAHLHTRRDTLAFLGAGFYEPHTRPFEKSSNRNFGGVMKLGVDQQPAGYDGPPRVMTLDRNETRRFSVVQAHHSSRLLHSANTHGGVTIAGGRKRKGSVFPV